MAKDKKTWLMKNSAGEPDGMFTLVVTSFMLTAVNYVLSFFNALMIGGFVLSFTDFNVTYATTVLMPLTMAYFARRYSKDKNAKDIKQTRIMYNREDSEDDNVVDGYVSS